MWGAPNGVEVNDGDPKGVCVACEGPNWDNVEDAEPNGACTALRAPNGVAVPGAVPNVGLIGCGTPNGDAVAAALPNGDVDDCSPNRVSLKAPTDESVIPASLLAVLSPRVYESVVELFCPPIGPPMPSELLPNGLVAKGEAFDLTGAPNGFEGVDIDPKVGLVEATTGAGGGTDPPSL